MSVEFKLSEDFLAHLIEAEVIDEAHAVEAVDRQRTMGKPIGQLALQECSLNVKQLFEILAHQTDEGGLFGEIAIAMGFMSEPELTRLLALQKQLRPTIGQALLDLGSVTEETLRAERNVYLRKLEPILV